MRIICDKQHQQALNELFAPYQDLPLVLVQKELEFEEPAIYFKLNQLDDIITILESLHPNHSKIIGENQGRFYTLNIDDILFVEGLSKDTYAYTMNNSFRIKERVSNLEPSWNNYAFIRINKSMIVNTRKIQYILPTYASKLILHLTNDMEIEVSRAYAKEFKKKMKVKL